ncbi:hypothetical protein PSECIP111951_00794 [Pseudoalteromonas holothuriae]|uniref:Uncharacterized protein n=1 Tax=Pseudoalteromonas holothuriae TaxID=2963714 RepID=A0ABM9GEV0_9GAMM|nr:hypothetical protein PSECIP111951_00794 [Pseudoalteromonas sp. CIP111951]
MRLGLNLGRDLSVMKIVNPELLKLITGGDGGPGNGPALPQQQKAPPFGG